MKKHFLQALFLFMVSAKLIAQNPVIQTMYTADPAPMVHNDTLFLYVGRDEDDAPKRYLMREYRVFSTTDMVNWTAHKTPLETSDFGWSTGDANASQCIGRDGKFYWYISTGNKQIRGVSVGVAVSGSPYGPFVDPLGKALVSNDMTTFTTNTWDDLDPSVFIDDDGQAYLFWGNNACYWAKLNNDMVSLDGGIHALDIFDKSAFGPDFEEAPWIYKRNDMYYLLYASGIPESLHYTMSENIEGPWKYQGVVMPIEGISGTNHPGVVDYKGNSYLFYHNAALPEGHGNRRSVCVEQFMYNADGTLPQMKMTEGIVKGVGTLNPFQWTEAETIAWAEGVKLDADEKTGVFVTSIHNGDYIKVRDVNFGNGDTGKFTARVSCRYFGGNIELRLDKPDGELIGSLPIPYTGGWDAWELYSTDVQNVNGVHDLYLVFKGSSPAQLFNFDYWQFEKSD
jgi:Beta-xylosidase